MKQIGILKVSTGQTAKVFHDVEFSEFRVKFYDDEGQHMTDADYHTDDEADARGTARAELERMKAQD